MINWRVYYGDGSVIDSSQRKPEHIPATGVIVIVQRNPLSGENPFIQHMTDYYVWLGDHWLGCDIFRLFQYWFIDGDKYDFPRAALAGETIANDDYLRIRKTAKRDPDFFNGGVGSGAGGGE